MLLCVGGPATRMTKRIDVMFAGSLRHWLARSCCFGCRMPVNVGERERKGELEGEKERGDLELFLYGSFFKKF